MTSELCCILIVQWITHLTLSIYNLICSVQMKPILTRWLLLWLRARKLPNLTDEEVMEYLMRGVTSSHGILDKVKTRLGDDHVKMLNLGHDWLQSYLPFVLQKVNRVHFGLLQPYDV